jgi:glycosyltransferase involved in cell wall biosynthesis
MKVLLFDYRAGGHHGLYIERIVDVLRQHAELVVAAPKSVTECIEGVDIIDTEGSVSTRARRTALTRVAGTAKASKELFAFEQAEKYCAPDVSFHLFADRLLPLLILRRPRPVPRVLLLFRPRYHYREAYSTILSPSDRVLAAIYERLLQIWRKRTDAQAIFALDEVAVQRWNMTGGAPAYWFPEPPLIYKPQSVDLCERSGVVLFGSLAPRKGVDLLAQAVIACNGHIPVTLAGNVHISAKEYITRSVALMRNCGVSVEIHDRWHSEEQALALLSRARCTALPYVGHFGMSRVLLESCVAGTPVVAHSSGLVAHLVRTHKLGLVADATNPVAFGAALSRIYNDADLWSSSARAARDFAVRYSAAHFGDALLNCLPQMGDDCREAY